jgi:hypothetical protein
MRIPFFWDVTLHCRIINLQLFHGMLVLQVSIIPRVSKLRTLADKTLRSFEYTGSNITSQEKLFLTYTAKKTSCKHIYVCVDTVMRQLAPMGQLSK